MTLWLLRLLPISPDRWFWAPTRIVSELPNANNEIHEMPAFTFIYGDLHAHAMALPLAALALALVVAVVRDARSLMSTWVRLGLLGLVLGALSATNTWDLPTYALVVVCALVIAALAQERSRRTLVGLIAALAGVGLVAYLSFLPFHLHNASVYQGFTRWHGRQSRFFDYLTVHGLFLFAVVSATIVAGFVGIGLGALTAGAIPPARPEPGWLRHLARTRGNGLREHRVRIAVERVGP